MCSNNCSLDGSLVGFANHCMHVQVQRCSRKVFERLVQSVLLCQLRCSVLIQWQAALVTVQLQCGFMSDTLSHTGDTHVKQSKGSSAHAYASARQQCIFVTAGTICGGEFPSAYSVQPGYTLADIAATCNTSLADLETANPQLSPDFSQLSLNEIVCIPSNCTSLVMSEAAAAPNGVHGGVTSGAAPSPTPSSPAVVSNPGTSSPANSPSAISPTSAAGKHHWLQPPVNPSLQLLLRCL